ncbi:MAG: type VI secretion system protein TssA [Pirellulales bacterium]
MAKLNVDDLLRPLSESAPCGVDLEYDPQFVEMGRAAQRVPDQQYGDTVIPGKEPDWKLVKDCALDLLARTRDLRAAVLLTQAVLWTDGLAAFADALSVVRGYVEQFWDTVYPQLDPDDDNDPTLRVNSIATLADNGTMVLPLQRYPIVRSRVAGSFSHRDLGVVSGEFPRGENDDDEAIESRGKLIDAAFEDSDVGVLRADALAAAAAADAAKGLDVSLTKAVGAGSTRSLAPLVKELQAIHKILVDRLAKRGHGLQDEPAPEAAAPPPADAPAETSAGETVGVVSGAAPATVVRLVRDWNADITSRDDAIKALEKVCLYFEKFEPSSPLPLLLRRAKRLSTKSFLEILKDISPDGLGQAAALGGIDRDD